MKRIASGGISRLLASAMLVCGPIVVGCSPKAFPEQTPTTFTKATVETGVLRGGVINGIALFKNIPYAAPPVGERRWRPPQPAPAWQGERDATHLGNACMQNRTSGLDVDPNTPLSEDCLYLNVWGPASRDANGKLPVMVWIHGGANAIGTGSTAELQGDRLAAKGVVVVTLNYRLGRFGFFAHPALMEIAGNEPLGNYAIMDQIAALQWVRRNIRSFGGDARNITIFGESAGGDAVQNLMLSPMARGLFSKSIAQSGGGRYLLPMLHEDLKGLPSAETRGIAFANEQKLDHPNAAALRALSAEKVLGRVGLYNWDKEEWCSVMIDGRVVRSQVIEGFAEGKQAAVPFLVGANGFELGGIPWVFRNPIIKELLPRLGGNEEAVRQAYGSEDDFNIGFLSDLNLVEPARAIARLASRRQPTYLYRFNYVIEDQRAGAKGAPHASDVPFVFGYLNETGKRISDADHVVEGRLITMWSNFAKTGKPSASGNADWDGYDSSVDRLYDIAIDGSTSMEPAGSKWLDAIGRYATGQPAPLSKEGERLAR